MVLLQKLARQIASMREKMWLTVNYGEGVSLTEQERQDIVELCQLHGCRVSFQERGMIIVKQDCSEEIKQ